MANNYCNCNNYNNCNSNRTMNYNTNRGVNRNSNNSVNNDYGNTCGTRCGNQSNCSQRSNFRNNDSCDRKQLLNSIRAYSFAIIDVGLYLDTNPECELALEYYNTYRDLYSEAVEVYENNFGPLSIYGNQNDDRWEWTCAPWPWEGEE